VKLLRVLQEGEVVAVGSSRSRKVDVRIPAATNRPILPEVAVGRFREDLFHRLPVALLRLPPLRERREDLPLLIGHGLEQDQERSGQPGFVEKKLSAGARNLLLRHSWPGKARELQNTLTRAAIWTPAGRSRPLTSGRRCCRSARPRGTGSSTAHWAMALIRLCFWPEWPIHHYLEREPEEAAGNKTRAAKLVGLPSYQTLSNRMKRYEVTS
jgi:transcriptional regulator with GAF, ATPase, and Fis domain